MQKVRHTSVAPTRTQRLRSGGEIDAHRHDEHQIVYASQGTIAVTTDTGSWVAPATRALWIPAGTVHQHQAHGELALHLVGLPATENPLGLDKPAVLAVSPLLRELIVAYTRDPDSDSPPHHRLRAVMLDQLTTSPTQPLHLPTPTDPLLRELHGILRTDPADNRSLDALGRQIGASARTLSRRLRDNLGLTYPQWRTQVRLHHALILLADGTPITTVAHQCGWSSASTFIDVFRRTFGHTPGARPSPDARLGQS
ncbi:AraC family transcriptional regulator [Streptomyces lucensis JCM 4490]|uniref:HTH-type transcriptional regulator RipA n=1 Tax=Streptomyces lucensis JCM 4490 TaxID=1306176 RepID=A0A918JA65_9ACTN|nr:helix-turn-helix transcriptional regulator [Streptomyces lucensis]GGW57052.1 AraC family transcriptional regulator [Streptomyces lucensis JCM 4490]